MTDMMLKGDDDTGNDDQFLNLSNRNPYATPLSTLATSVAGAVEEVTWTQRAASLLTSQHTTSEDIFQALAETFNATYTKPQRHSRDRRFMDANNRDLQFDPLVNLEEALISAPRTQEIDQVGKRPVDAVWNKRVGEFASTDLPADQVISALDETFSTTYNKPQRKRKTRTRIVLTPPSATGALDPVEQATKNSSILYQQSQQSALITSTQGALDDLDALEPAVKKFKGKLAKDPAALQRLKSAAQTASSPESQALLKPYVDAFQQRVLSFLQGLNPRTGDKPGQSCIISPVSFEVFAYFFGRVIEEDWLEANQETNTFQCTVYQLSSLDHSFGLSWSSGIPTKLDVTLRLKAPVQFTYCDNTVTVKLTAGFELSDEPIAEAYHARLVRQSLDVGDYSGAD